jgi:uncharacterized membrane protein YkvA (DUF1232 family)
MDQLMEWIKIAAIAAGIIIVLLIVLISLPNSPVRKWLLKIVGSLLYAVVVLCLVYIINPADLVPDVLPVVGQVDDIGALVTAVLNLVGGSIMLAQKSKPVRARVSREGQ